MDGNLELEVPFSEKLLFVRLIFFNIETEMKLGHTQTCTHINDDDDAELSHAQNT